MALGKNREPKKDDASLFFEEFSRKGAKRKPFSLGVFAPLRELFSSSFTFCKRASPYCGVILSRLPSCSSCPSWFLSAHLNLLQRNVFGFLRGEMCRYLWPLEREAESKGIIDSEVDCGTLRCVLPPQSGLPLVALVPQAMQDPINPTTIILAQDASATANHCRPEVAPRLFNRASVFRTTIGCDATSPRTERGRRPVRRGPENSWLHRPLRKRRRWS